MSKVSILIPCYNAERWIAQAIESALSQTYDNTEVIVVDDGSTDGSLSVVQRFGDAIRWESGPNRGGNIARNRLLELSKGEWLQYLDSDDYLLPEKIERQMAAIAASPDTDILYSPSVYCYVEGDRSHLEVMPILPPRDPWALLASWDLPQTGSPLWRRQAVLDAGKWKPGQPCCQEDELYLRLLKANKRFTFCADASSVYRQWSESSVCKRDKRETYRQRLAITRDLEQHLLAIEGLTPHRQRAINQARFECARIIWLSDRDWAMRVIQEISDSAFLPSGSAAPVFYRLVYRLFGFSAAERVADSKRSLSNVVSKAAKPLWKPSLLRN